MVLVIWLTARPPGRPDGDAGGGQRGTVDHGDAVRAGVDDIDLVGHRIDRNRRGRTADGHVAGAQRGAVNDGDVAAALVGDVNLVGGEIGSDGRGRCPHRDRAGRERAAVDHGDVVAALVGDIDFVGRRIDRDSHRSRPDCNCSNQSLRPCCGQRCGKQAEDQNHEQLAPAGQHGLPQRIWTIA